MKADEMPSAPKSQPNSRGEFCARTGTLTSWALVVVMLNDVLPLPVTEFGEKTQDAPEGRPEHENVTTPAKVFSDEIVTVLGAVAWPFATVSPPGMMDIEKSGMTSMKL